jgi:hypothetical protein
MTHPSPVELAKASYAAYGEATENRNYQGLPMPDWENLGDRVQKAWIAAAGSIAIGLLESFAQSEALVPDVGDLVLVPMDPEANNGASVAPAVVTRVWSATTVNVRVLADGEFMLWRTSLVYADDLNDVASTAAAWTWPGGE